MEFPLRSQIRSRTGFAGMAENDVYIFRIVGERIL